MPIGMHADATSDLADEIGYANSTSFAVERGPVGAGCAERYFQSHEVAQEDIAGLRIRQKRDEPFRTAMWDP